ncbi:MAG: SapC family protein [Pseudomonadota bacterium]
MTQHVMLDNVNHKDLRVRQYYGAESGFEANVARVFPIEFRRLQTTFPLFFVRNAEEQLFEPVALMGFERGENLFVGANGWEAPVMPLTLERQPFLIGYQEQERDGVIERVPVVNVDIDHPAVNDVEGERVFLPQGGESPFLEQISAILMMIHEGHDAIRAFSQALVGLELIESVTIEATFVDGSQQTLEGLHTINEERLRALPGGALEVLHKGGMLEAVFMMLAAGPMLERVIERKNRQVAGG